MTKSVVMVAVSNPPITVIAIGCNISAPLPIAKAMGISDKPRHSCSAILGIVTLGAGIKISDILRIWKKLIHLM